MTKKFNHYLGMAGHLAVMSEFLMLGWNVAIPEVDVGDDIFVIQDSNGTLRRVQVKTSMTKNRKSGFSAQFNISVKNLRSFSNIAAYYVFIVRHNNKWINAVVIDQIKLLDNFEQGLFGSKLKKNITLYFSYQDERVICAKQDFTKYQGDFSAFAKIIH